MLGGFVLSPTSAFASNPTDSNFAGYLASQPQVSIATATFVVPRIRCDVGSNLAMGVGVLIFGNSGTPTATGAIIRSECVNGTPTYQVGVIANGTKTAPRLRVRPGNLVEIDLAESTSTSVSVANHTTGKAFEQASSGGVDMTLAEIGIIGIGATSGPPAFKSVSFSGSLVDGIALDSLSSAPAAWDWANSGVTVIHTSRITSDAFTTKYL
jgi:Peptidase A4 family